MSEIDEYICMYGWMDGWLVGCLEPVDLLYTFFILNIYKKDQRARLSVLDLIKTHYIFLLLTL